MEKFIGNAYTASEMITLLEELPKDATTNLATFLEFGCRRFVAVWYDEKDNIILFK